MTTKTALKVFYTYRTHSQHLKPLQHQSAYNTIPKVPTLPSRVVDLVVVRFQRSILD